MSTKVLVHVGAPKTGTSFVQDLLFRNRERLAEQGVLYAADRFDAHFLAALDLLELPWGGLEKQAVGSWDRLAEQVREWPGTAIVSHEILATASRPQVRRAVESFGAAETHVVMSARDLVRQIPAEWQENVKHRRTLTYGTFLERITDRARTGELASWFWGVQEVPAVLERWGEGLRGDHVHLVTVPKPGAPRDLLWRRFASVLGLDPDAYAATEDRANTSLGVAEVALVRRLNERLNGVLPNEHYREFVRELLAHRTLSRRSERTRITLPPTVRAWAADLSEQWVEALASRGYDVVGSLDELRADRVEQPWVDPDEPDETRVAEVAMDALVTSLVELGKVRDETHALREELRAVRTELVPPGRWLRAKRRVVRSADTNPTVAAGLGAYRRIRGR